MKKTVMVIITLMVFKALPVSAASFDCGKASTNIEKLICGDTELSNLDEQLANEFKSAFNRIDDKYALKDEQNYWLKSRRDCKDVTCLKKQYSARVQLLSITALGEKATELQKKASKRFFLEQGSQYEVCRVVNDYLNSSYYKEGDCIFNEYPLDGRLKMPKLIRVDYQLYKEQLIQDDFKRIEAWDKDPKVQDERKKYAIKFYSDERKALWKLTADLDNNGTADSLLYSRQIELVSQCNTPGSRLPGQGGVRFLDKNNRFEYRWDDWGVSTDGMPFYFGDRVFVLLGGGLVVSVMESYPKVPNHIKEICDSKIIQ